jgi:hypothetical protein
MTITAPTRSTSFPLLTSFLKLKDMSPGSDPYRHYRTVMDLFRLKNVPVVVLNVMDAEGVLINPTHYSQN